MEKAKGGRGKTGSTLKPVYDDIGKTAAHRWQTMALVPGGTMRNGFDARYQVKQYVAKLRSPVTGATFRVFTTGDEKFYLFDPLDEHGCSRCMAFPVRKADLKPEYRRALAKGWGNTV